MPSETTEWQCRSALRMDTASFYALRLLHAFDHKADTALTLRRIVNLAQIIQSHALSFFYLSSPDLLLGYDYVSGLFVDDRFGEVAGTLPLSAIGLAGATRVPRPAIVVAFRTFERTPGDKAGSAPLKAALAIFIIRPDNVPTFTHPPGYRVEEPDDQGEDAAKHVYAIDV